MTYTREQLENALNRWQDCDRPTFIEDSHLIIAAAIDRLNSMIITKGE